MKALVLSLILVLSLTGCGWDTDEEFLPEWKASWILSKDSTGARSWMLFTQEGMLTMPSTVTPKRITSWQDDLWAADVDGKVLQLDAESGEVLNQFSPPSGLAIETGGGLDQLYVCTDDSMLYLFDGVDTWTARSLPAQPGLIQTRSDRAFLVIGDTVIWKIQEQTFSPRDSFSFTRAVTRLQNDNGVETWVTHEDSSDLYLSRLNYHGQVFRFYEQRQLVDDILYNPLLRAETGIEYIGNLEVEEGCLTTFPEICGDQFWPVWEAGLLIVTRSDSAYLYNLIGGQILRSFGAFSGRITDGENVIR